MRGPLVSACLSCAMAWAALAQAQEPSQPTTPSPAPPAPAPAPEVVVPAAPPVSTSPPSPEIATPATVSPSAPRATGFSLGLRLAYAFPLGSLSKNDALSSNLSGMLPLWLDAGYRL